MDVYFEKQDIDDERCRIHSINNVLGKRVLSRNTYTKYCNEYDNIHNCKGSSSFFIVDTDTNIVSFILRKLDVKTEYYPLGFQESRRSDAASCIRLLGSLYNELPFINDSDRFLIFSSQHIWC